MLKATRTVKETVLGRLWTVEAAACARTGRGSTTSAAPMNPGAILQAGQAEKRAAAIAKTAAVLLAQANSDRLQINRLLCSYSNYSYTLQMGSGACIQDPYTLI